MPRFGCALMLAIAAQSLACAEGSGDATTAGDASVASDTSITSSETTGETAPPGGTCDPASDSCPPSQHCSPILKQCIDGCRSDAGCSGSTPHCDVPNHSCVRCLENAHCDAGNVCSGGACVPGCNATTPCPGGLDCCAGACVDIAKNIDHCGACGKKCRVDHGVSVCTAGTCKVSACTVPYENCDAIDANGCETDTSSDDKHCGGCGAACKLPRATAKCSKSTCAVTGCESNYGNCNGTASDGCEVDLRSDPANCGACGAKKTETCNLADDDCNSKCDDVDGCRIGVHRSVGVEHFYTVDKTEAACCGFKVEQFDAFFLYASSQPGKTTPFHRCYNPAAGRHFYTTDPGCEGFGSSEGVMGHIGNSDACGAVPLYRLYHAPTKDHLFTVDAAERDAAGAAGWVIESPAGFVWRAPKG